MITMIAAETYSFTGVLSADNLSGSLTISKRDDSSDGVNTRIGLGSATVAVTLR